ncbi:hypothetical protein [Bradyrhizobium sp. LA7.1]|uniref:hypothetical protein n=1 Tax=Bradyrhizobium sp. LA7.1 TaxID=3156324 RepID=UPI00339A9815
MTNLITKIIPLALLTFAVTGAATTVAYSQATAAAPRSAQSDLFRFGFNQSLTPPNRVELVRLIKVFCREVLDSVPTNTPAEEDWVMKEYKSMSNDSNRMMRLISSKEWARHQLVDVVSDCLQKVAQLQQAQTQDARTAEAAQFISLALTFNENSDSPEFAKRIGMKSELSAISLNIFRQVLMIAALRTLDGGTDPILSPPGEQQRR